MSRASPHKTVLVRTSGMLVVGAVTLFVPAGTVAWWNGWLYLVLGLGISVFMVRLARAAPELIEERLSARAKAKAWDRVLVLLLGALLPLALTIVAGLDHRFAWTTSVPAWASLVAFVVAVAAGAWTAWAMQVNAFFSSHVRIQLDRGHTVVTKGPYACIRHPGYAGSIVFSLAVPMVLGSLTALAVAATFVPVFAARTYLEDRTLRAELPGYGAYAKRVRYRLLPPLF